MPAPERFLSDEGMNVYDAAIKVIGELKAEIARQKEEIELQNIILNPGDHINEQKRGDETILVLTKGKWFIQSMREKHKLAKKNEEIAALLKGRKSIVQFMKMEYQKELAKKNDELTRIKSKTRCAYCGFEIERDDTAAQKISEHIKACPKHPMRVWEARCEALEEQAKQYKDEIAALTAELQHAQGSYADGVGESRLEEQGLRKEIAALKDENLNLYEASRKTIAKREEQIAQLKIALKKI